MPGLGAARLAWLGLIVLNLLWFGWLAPAENPGRLGGVLLSVVPLLLPLWSIVRLRRDGLVIGGVILLGYFCFAVVEAWVDPSVRWLALLEIALVALYFVALPAIRRRRSGAEEKHTR